MTTFYEKKAAAQLNRGLTVTADNRPAWEKRRRERLITEGKAKRRGFRDEQPKWLERATEMRMRGLSWAVIGRVLKENPERVRYYVQTKVKIAEELAKLQAAPFRCYEEESKHVCGCAANTCASVPRK